MGRHRVGPRKLHGPEGLWYGVYRTKAGKTFRESLKTRDHAVAMRLWPAAFQRLKDRANGVRTMTPPSPLEVGISGDPDTGQTREVTPSDIYGPGEIEEMLSWEAAFEIHNECMAERRGRPIAAKSLPSQKAARVGLNQPPALMTVRDVQQYMQRMKDEGLSPATSGQRHGMCRAVVKSLVKQGYLKENVFDRVDASYAPGKTHPNPTPEEVKLLWDTGNWHMRVLLFTGLRENELCQRQQAHLDGRWLSIDRTLGCTVKNDDSLREVLLPEWAGTTLPKSPGKTTLWRLVKKVTPRLTLHSLRSATRTALRQAKVTTEVAERVLGHKVGREAGASHVDNYGDFNRETIGPAMEAAWGVMDEWIK